MPKAGIVGGIFGVALLGAILYFSMGLEQYTCEVCIDFQGRTQCRTASGPAQQNAVQTAQENACSYVVYSKTEGFLCGQLTPTRVTCQER